MLFTSKDEVILQQAWHALSAVTKTMDAEEQVRISLFRFWIVYIKQKEGESG